MSAQYEIGLFIYADGRRERLEVLADRKQWTILEGPVDSEYSPSSRLHILRRFYKKWWCYPPNWQGPHESEVRLPRLVSHDPFSLHYDPTHTPGTWLDVAIWCEEGLEP